MKKQNEWKFVVTKAMHEKYPDKAGMSWKKVSRTCLNHFRFHIISFPISLFQFQFHFMFHFSQTALAMGFQLAYPGPWNARVHFICNFTHDFRISKRPVMTRFPQGSPKRGKLV